LFWWIETTQFWDNILCQIKLVYYWYSRPWILWFCLVHKIRKITGTRTLSVLQYVVLLVTLDIQYLCKKFDHSSFNYSWDMFRALKLSGSHDMTWPCPFQRTVCRVETGTCYDRSAYQIWSFYYERMLVEILVYESGWVTFSANLRGNGASPTNDCWRRKTRVCSLEMANYCVYDDLYALLWSYLWLVETDALYFGELKPHNFETTYNVNDSL